MPRSPRIIRKLQSSRWKHCSKTIRRTVKVLHELGRLYHQYEQSDKAVEVYNRISEIAPTDLEAIKLGKDASARASMKKGGWTKAESYRDLIKDKDAAVSLEQQSRMQLSDESLEEQIDETFARHEAEPQSVDLAKRLGLLHDAEGGSRRSDRLVSVCG